MRVGRRHAGRGRARPDRRDLARPATASRSARSTLHDLRFAGEDASSKLARVQPRSPSSRPMRSSSPIRTRSPGCSTSAAPMSHTRRCRSCFAIVPREGRPSLYVDGRKLSNDVRHRLEEVADVREPADFERDLAALGEQQAHRAARSGDRGGCAGAPDHRPWRQGRARRRSDRADEGGEEPGGDCRRARRAGARRRRDGALSRLVRPRGAARQTDRDRRRQGAGKLPPRHRPAQGRVVPDHLGRRPRRRHRALPRHREDQPEDPCRANSS